MLVQFVNYELKVFIRLTTEIPLKSLHTFVVIFCLEWLVNVHPDPMNNGPAVVTSLFFSSNV